MEERRYTVVGESLSWREVDGEVVILDLSSSKYLALNGPAALMWKRLAVGASPAELAELLLQTYEVDAARAGSDARAFLADCTERGLVE